MLSNLDIWKNNADLKEVNKINLMSEEELKTFFSSPLHFGTAGARAKIGPGSNAFNIYTVRQIAYAYLNFLQTKFKDKLSDQGIVIFHDNRNNGEEFVNEVAKIFTNNSIKVIIAKENKLKTTPFLSYVIMKLNLLGGMNFTASHNPKEYHGCKIYNEFGYQLLPDDTDIIANKMVFSDEIFKPVNNINAKFLIELSDEMESQYLNDVSQIVLNDTLDKKISILFSPQHGTAFDIIPKILKKHNYDVDTFKMFQKPDPNFTNIKYINPEDPRSFDILIEHSLKTKKYDCLFMVDPDSDRFALAAKNKQDKYTIFNGNEIATIFLNYIIENYKMRNINLEDYFFVTTHVSSPLTSIMAKSNKIETHITDTGFKWIADTIYKITKNNKKYLFGYEEAIGFLPRDIVLDKDGIQSCLLFADILNYYKNNNIEFDSLLDIIYKKYFAYKYESINYILDNNEQKLKFIEHAKSMPLNIDDNHFSSKEIISSKKEPNPTIKFYFTKEKDSFVAIRLSGTEPKIKIYICLKIDKNIKSDLVISNLKKYFDNLFNKVKK